MSNGGGRRSSVSSGLLLIALGVILLLYRFEPGMHIGHLLWVYWPLLIIFLGILKLVDHLMARGDGAGGTAHVSGGEVLLVIFAILVLTGYGFHDWLRTKYPDMGLEFGPFSQQFTQSKELYS